jgi:hypothetical protein
MTRQREMNKEPNRMRKSILTNIRQLLLIVFSVVLGIFLSERIEESKNKKEAALLLEKIKSEVNSNKKLLAQWTPYHREIVNRLDSLSHDEEFINQFIADESTLFNTILTKGSLMGRSPSHDAWDIAKSHPLIVHFDYEALLILSKIYKQQEMTYKAVPKMMELFLSADFNARANAKSNLRTFKNQMQEIASREIQWLHYFRDAEKILDLPDE